MGACAQIAVFTYAVMRRTPRYEIRLAAFFADNLMNSVAHCGEQPINVERPLRHIYFIDGCRRIKIERNNLLCEQAPTEVFRSIFAWLVTFNLFLFRRNLFQILHRL